jgi:hypothetical protein
MSVVLPPSGRCQGRWCTCGRISVIVETRPITLNGTAAAGTVERKRSDVAIYESFNRGLTRPQALRLKMNSIESPAGLLWRWTFSVPFYLA